MSFNILTTKPDEARINRVVNTILHADPDTVGLQEVSPYWMDILKKRLGDTYGYVGEGRDGGHNGEYSCIFYKKALFEVLDSGTYWLSETPDKVSSHETSAYRRIMTFAKLLDKNTGREFVHVNTHLDHASHEARRFQAGVLVDFAKKYMDVPVLMSGDFNCTASEDTYKVITKASFTNAAQIAGTAEKKPTFPGNGRIIDFIFCNSDVYPTEYEVIDEIIDGEYPSDHYPILVRYGM
jgi:endonuclease/exonuclease/phosphatase family metal-dependent hydrolase